jgi:hypothetical protein
MFGQTLRKVSGLQWVLKYPISVQILVKDEYSDTFDEMRLEKKANSCDVYINNLRF